MTLAIIETPTLSPCECGGKATCTSKPEKVSCVRCGQSVKVETTPFFADPASQREHESWRAVLAWNNIGKENP